MILAIRAFISENITRIVILLFIGGMVVGGLNHIQNKEAEIRRLTADIVVQKLRAEVAEKARDLIAKTHADMQRGLDEHAARVRKDREEAARLLEETNRIKEHVEQPAPVEPAPAAKPAAKDTALDAINRAAGIADRMLERASKVR